MMLHSLLFGVSALRSTGRGSLDRPCGTRRLMVVSYPRLWDVCGGIRMSSQDMGTGRLLLGSVYWDLA